MSSFANHSKHAKHSGPIALTGATGLLGGAVLRLASERGLGPIRALVRPGSPHPDGLEVIEGDLASTSALAELVSGASAVVHLAAAMGAVSAADLRLVNVEGTRHLLAAASAAGVPRFVFTSSVAASRPEHGPYSCSKLDAEQLVLDATGKTAVLRLPVLFGPGSQVETAVLGLARHLPLIPVIRGGLLRPLHIDDAAAACLAAVSHPEATGLFSLAGPDALPFPQFATRLARGRGLRRRGVGLPAGLFLLAARALEFAGQPGVGVESVRAAAAGTPRSAGDLAALGWSPRPLSDWLP